MKERSRPGLCCRERAWRRPPGGGEQRDFGAGEVGQRVSLEIAPQVLDRVQLRGIGREVKLPPLHHIKEHGGMETAMDFGAIPEQEQRSIKVPGELLQESQHRHRVEVLIDQQLKVQAHFAPVGTDAQGGDGRDLFVVATNVPEHRGLSAPAPGAAYHRQQKQPALVEKNQPSVQAPGFFLIRGHSCLIQRWMPSSSRSKARRVGRCGVQPSERSSRPIWST
jgi:hypothetical protein